MAEAAAEEEKAPEGTPIPPWMATFADLMCLLMCFFVLLFAFSDIEKEKFKKVAGSMKQAFGGVQFIKSNSEDSVEGLEKGIVSKTGSMSTPLDQKTEQAAREARTEQLLKELKSVMSQEIDEQKIVVEKDGEDIIIRFPEHVSFASGKAELVPTAVPLIQRVVELIDAQQKIIVAGHTDNVPIRSGRFRSNWELSATRAAAVAEVLVAAKSFDPTMLTVAGYADTRPLVANDTAENRAKNRRVEIIARASITDADGQTTEVDVGRMIVD